MSAGHSRLVGRRQFLVQAGRGALGIAVLGLAGCGTKGEPTTVPARLAAPPQSAKLEWLETYTAKAPALVFGVTAFAVTADGWSANISVENRSDVGWKIVDANPATNVRLVIAHVAR